MISSPAPVAALAAGNTPIEDCFTRIKNADWSTQYLTSKGEVRDHCGLRKILVKTGLIKWSVVRKIFGCCESVSLIEAKIALQDKIAAYQKANNGSVKPLQEQYALVTAVQEKFNQLCTRVNQSRQLQKRQDLLPDMIQLPTFTTHHSWIQIAHERGVAPPQFSEPAVSSVSASSHPMLLSTAMLPVFSPPAADRQDAPPPSTTPGGPDPSTDAPKK